jgi:hypothetical protein
MIKRIAALAAVAVMVAGCDYLPFGYTPVKDIVAGPAAFEGKEVKLKGTVKDVTKVPVVDLKSFVISDGTGEIAVTTQDTLPAVNDDVALKGTVTSAAILGGQALGLHVRETKRLQ